QLTIIFHDRQSVSANSEPYHIHNFENGLHVDCKGKSPPVREGVPSLSKTVREGIGGTKWDSFSFLRLWLFLVVPDEVRIDIFDTIIHTLKVPIQNLSAFK
ncbi:MAG TPA: hypothetical protein VGO47_13650, partial [Chlamydiales bacterium]|nr:hypothetical protein [Chlamydiales bacterium]